MNWNIILSIVGLIVAFLQGIIIWQLNDIKASVHSLWKAHDEDVDKTHKQFQTFEGRVSRIEAKINKGGK